MFGGNKLTRIIQSLSSSDSYFRIRKQKDIVIEKLFPPLFRTKISADFITSAGFLAGIISLLFLQTSHVLFLSLWTVARFFDLIDGTLHRSNYKTWSKSVNLDKYADITYDTLLTFAAVPYTGLTLALVSVVARLLHVKLENKNWANSFLSPHGGFTHFFFIIRKFKEGVFLQTIYSLTVPIFTKFLNYTKNKNKASI
ncbi:hypothetical protein JW766_05985 [Candidatus Dojkabacteria bacterium]|nr:hypothetical protein [Candidatus Dojkabacteria bacterium]